MKISKTKDSTVIEGLPASTIIIKDNYALDNPNSKPTIEEVYSLRAGEMMLHFKKYNIRELWMDIFRRGMNAHESWKDKSDIDLQTVFDYWLKEK